MAKTPAEGILKTDFSKIADPPQFTIDRNAILAGVQFTPAAVSPPRTVHVDPNAISNFVGALVPIPFFNEPRVVQQSVPAGSLVPIGSRIDLTLAPARHIPFDVFETPLAELKGKTIGDAAPALENTTVANTLLRFAAPEDVPDAEKVKFISAVNATKVATINNETFSAAFRTLQGAIAFK